MSDFDRPARSEPHLCWVFAHPLDTALWAATWLETTRAMRKMGWHVTLMTPGPEGIRSVQGVEVQGIPRPRVYFLGMLVFQFRLLRFLMSDWTRFDVVLFHQESVLLLLAWRILSKLTGRRRPLLVKDTRTVTMTVATPRLRLRAAHDNLMNQLANRWADGQTAITTRMASAVHVPPDRLWGIWPSGADLERFASVQNGRRWPSAGDPIHLVYIGALYQERNLVPLCQAVEDANAEGLAFILTITGDGPERQALQMFAEHSDGRIRVLGVVPHDQVQDVLAQAHVGVLPFPDEERFRVSSPTKLFEYMAAGLPILATRIVCHTDVVQGGHYAFWAEEAEVSGLHAALRLAWRGRDALEAMGREAADAAQSWTWQASASKLSEALKLGMARQGGPGK